MCKISEVFKKCSDTRYLIARKQFRMAETFPVNAVYINMTRSVRV